MVGFFEGIADSEQNQKLVTNQYLVDGNSVVSVGRYSGAVKATGKFLQRLWAMFGNFVMARSPVGPTT